MTVSLKAAHPAPQHHSAQMLLIRADQAVLYVCLRLAFMLPAAILFESKMLPLGTRPSLAIFSNPPASIPSLEAAVRHNWDASTAPGQDSTGQQLAFDTIWALAQTMSVWESKPMQSLLDEDRSALIQHITTSSKSSTLLSLLLSCMKQLQHSCRRNPRAAIRAAAIAGMAGDVAIRLFWGMTESAAGVTVAELQSRSDASASAGLSAGSSSSASSAAPNSTSSTAATSSSSAKAVPSDRVQSEFLEAVALSTTALDLYGSVAHEWIVLFGRVLYTAGAALQAAAASGVASPDVNSASALPINTSATHILADLKPLAAWVSVYSEPDAAIAAVMNRKRVQAAVPAAWDRSPLETLQAQPLGRLLEATAQHAKQLEEAAGSSSSAGGGGSMAEGQQGEDSNMRVWRQTLSSEQGRQLPQAVMDVGSSLCAALPSRFCCNMPSCCCLDKPCELQLALGKGTKCSGCGVARYCSPAHQRLHWKQHKPACKAIAAAVAAGEASK